MARTVAARRAGITAVIMPKLNEKDIPDLPKEIRKSLTLVPVETMDEVLEIALEQSPESARVTGKGPDSVGAYAH